MHSLGAIVGPAEEAQVVRVSALHAQTQAIHPMRSQHTKDLGIR